MRVLFFGTFDERRHPRVRVLREGLAASDIEVDVVNHPLTDSTETRVAAASNPLVAAKWLASLLGAWGRLLWNSRRVTAPDVIVVGYLGVLDVVLARLRWPRRVVVLDHMAPLAGVAVDRGVPKIATIAMRCVDALAERLSDLTIFDTAENAQLSSLADRRKLVIHVGATADWYGAGMGRGSGDELDVVFYGLFTPLQGAVTIGEAIASLTDRPIRFTMIGSGQDLEAARTAAGPDGRVTWIPWVDPSDLPRVVGQHDVCLGIFGATQKAHRVIPNKVFQGAAAGCAIVTLDSSAQRLILENAAVYVPPGDANALAGALADLADHRDRLSQLQVSARAAAESWRPTAVVKPLMAALRRTTSSNMRSVET